MNDNPFRTPHGGRIDRNRPLRFTFDGRSCTGYEGDTLASALLANGVRITARSFKYHRPRGIMGAGLEEPASFVELAGNGGAHPITTVPLTDGLEARAVNCRPSAAFDWRAVFQLAAPFMPAGFYYKTFMWPDWRLFEPAIRRAAGLARPPAAPPETGRFEARYAHADVLIVGAGPAGLAAALAAGRAGVRVFLADDGLEPGGALLNRRMRIGAQAAADWAADAAAELALMENIIHLQNTIVWGHREHNLVIAAERRPPEFEIIERSWRIRAARVIITAGAVERHLVFAGNDRPGVMLASAAQAYVNHYAVRPGREAVVFANNDSAWAAAADLAAAGVNIRAIVDVRDEISAAVHAPLGAEVMTGHVVAEALGGRRVKAVMVRPRGGGPQRRIKCDLLACSGGWNPAVHLFSQSGGTLRYDETAAAFLPDTPAQPAVCAGAAAGAFTLRAALKDGAEKGCAAARAVGSEPEPLDIPEAEDEPCAVSPLWRVTPERPGAKAFVDIQNDVTAADITMAVREGYSSIEHIKRYTTAGMGPDQGKTGAVNVIGAAAEELGKNMSEVGTTTFRAPYAPVSFGALAGARGGPVILPYRHTPVTERFLAQDAFMYEAGARWRRPGYFPEGGETFQETVNRECRAVREGAGVYDGSPLGMFELKGPDVSQFLDFIYTNVFSTLKTGQGRYGLMLTDDGLIFDDGVTFRLSEDRFLMSTSTGHADAIHRHMEKILQIERPEWRVKITSVTEQWCNATVCGPKAREVMARLGSDINLSAENLPFMSFRDGRAAGLPARVVRVSFTGELSFEINVRPRDMRTLWDRVLEAGAPFGIETVGSEASHVLRVEKGFLSLGHEVDGTADPYDLGIGWIMSKKKPDFIGRRAVEIRRAGGDPRRELTGVTPLDPDRQIPEGAPLTPGGRRENSEGFVTACVWSGVNRRWVGLALLSNGRARIGETVYVRTEDGVIPVTVTQPCFHDPDGERLRS